MIIIKCHSRKLQIQDTFISRISSGRGKVVLPFMASYLVLLKLSFIKFLTAQTLIFSASRDIVIHIRPNGYATRYVICTFSHQDIFREVGLISLTTIGNGEWTTRKKIRALCRQEWNVRSPQHRSDAVPIQLSAKTRS